MEGLLENQHDVVSLQKRRVSPVEVDFKLKRRIKALKVMAGKIINPLVQVSLHMGWKQDTGGRTVLGGHCQWCPSVFPTACSQWIPCKQSMTVGAGVLSSSCGHWSSALWPFGGPCPPELSFGRPHTGGLEWRSVNPQWYSMLEGIAIVRICICCHQRQIVKVV